MFTGIIQGKAEVVALEQLNDFMRLTLLLPEERADNLQLGASIAVNGTCLTVTAFDGNRVNFDLIMETLKVTNLADLQLGGLVNFERAARIGDEIGGHLLSGHVHDQVEIVQIERPENNCILWFEVAPQWLKYILPKGFVALNGASLTIGEVRDNRFNVYLIPETLALTTFGSATVGERINLEIDPQTQATVDTVERYLASRG
ncbi:riboflavin synthase subunit alpha [Marinobacterium arenosum]|uniref:riboflavin synthase subunit alpha n=1 Tax=Marinobacterium arenosum TaxID=2862496 RepID=UPI001C95512F|nr:riboflavin synthase subunit alpha [Marinobacterium arenosum]MBY4677992.1 riboflavin synthase subunit alpha [Marinobacterium arenosum]